MVNSWKPWLLIRDCLMPCCRTAWRPPTQPVGLGRMVSCSPTMLPLGPYTGEVVAMVTLPSVAHHNTVSEQDIPRDTLPVCVHLWDIVEDAGEAGQRSHPCSPDL